MRVWPGLCFILLFSYSGAKAMDAAVWHTVFYLPGQVKGAAARPYVEAYWQLNPRTLYYVKQHDSSLVAKIRTSIVFSTDTGIINEEHYILETAPAKGKKEILAQSILELHRYLLPYGKIKMQIVLKDMADSVNKFTYTDTFTIAKEDTGLQYSEIELLDTVYPSSAQTVFQKNDLQQIPLCTNFLDTKREKLHFYVELYNANTAAPEQYPLTEFIFISKKVNDMAFPEFIQTDSMLKNTTDVRPYIGSFDISKLNSGNYFLNIYLRSRQGQTLASKAFFFQRENNRPKIKDTGTANITDTAVENVTILNLHKTFLAKYTLPQIMAMLKMIIPLSDQQGVQTIHNFLKRPDELYMRYYIYNFFSSIDHDNPAKAWEAYSVKVREVNRLFSSSNMQGYETDRGIMYLRYGKPTDRVIVENESGAYPYEVWLYDALNAGNKRINNAFFLFYRPGELVADMRLLHSNVTGEIRTAAWRTYLYISGTGSGNLNARAEQYIEGR